MRVVFGCKEGHLRYEEEKNSGPRRLVSGLEREYDHENGLVDELIVGQ